MRWCPKVGKDNLDTGSRVQGNPFEEPGSTSCLVDRIFNPQVIFPVSKNYLIIQEYYQCHFCVFIGDILETKPSQLRQKERLPTSECERRLGWRRNYTLGREGGERYRSNAHANKYETITRIWNWNKRALKFIFQTHLYKLARKKLPSTIKKAVVFFLLLDTSHPSPQVCQ